MGSYRRWKEAGAVPLTPQPDPVQCECGASLQYRLMPLSTSQWVLQTCSTCRAARQAQTAAKAWAESVHREISLSGVPSHLWTLTLDGLINETNEDRLRKLQSVVESGGSVHLCGKTGRGKTVAAIAALLHHIRHTGRSGRFMRESDVDAGTKADIRKEWRHAGLLVIDDLGSTKGGLPDWLQSFICDIIDHRALWRLPTVVTSEHSLADVAQVYPARVAYRLFQMCEGKQITFTGPNYRAELKTFSGGDQ